VSNNSELGAGDTGATITPRSPHPGGSVSPCCREPPGSPAVAGDDVSRVLISTDGPSRTVGAGGPGWSCWFHGPTIW
jgi:hypothetical protein